MFIDPKTTLLSVPLAPQHDRQSFSCGVDSLDSYLKTRATQDQRKDLSRCFVCLEENQTTIIGYYTISNTHILITELSETEQKKLPKYPFVGGLLVGRLAVDTKQIGKGFGKILLMDALKRCSYLSEESGIYTVVVDALDQNVAHFYQKYGFLPLTNKPLKLHLSLKTIRKALDSILN